MLKYLQVAVFSNFFLFLHHRPLLQSILCSMILDPNFEVRETAATTLSGLIHCHFFDVDHLIIVSCVFVFVDFLFDIIASLIKLKVEFIASGNQDVV